MSLTFEPQSCDLPEAKLTIDGKNYYGINIIEKLHQMMDTVPYARMLFYEAITTHQRQVLPVLGFRLESELAIMPTKLITDIGYDITIISVSKQLTPMTTMFDTGVSLVIPLGYYIEMVPRSSLSKTGYMLANSVGVIDPGYTSTLKVPLVKIDASMPDLVLPACMCQLILKPYIVSSAVRTDFDQKIETARGDGGFGSTG